MPATSRADSNLRTEAVRGRLPLQQIAPKLANGSSGAQRGFVVGKSGSGKTYLAEHMLKVYGAGPEHPAPWRGYTIIADPNDAIEFPANRITEELDGIRPGKSYPVIKYRPAPTALTASAWNEFWKTCFHVKGNVLVYIDELFSLEPMFNKQSIDGGPNWMNVYLTRGRAKGKGCLMAAQRPAWIPGQVIANAEHVYIFDLPTQADRDRMASVVGQFSDDGEDLRSRDALNLHEFFYYGPGVRDPHRMKIV